MPISEIARERTVVASRWANAAAGAGSVRSSAGTYIACPDLIEAFLVERLGAAGAAEEAGLAAFGVGLEQGDDLDAGLEHLDGGSLLIVRGRLAVDRPPLLCLDLAEAVDRIADDVQDPAERLAPDRNR